MITRCKILTISTILPKAFLLAIILVILKPLNSFAQLSDSKIKTAYTYQFAQNIEWPKEQAIDSFKITVFSENQSIINEFKEISRTRKLKNKPIAIKLIDKIDQIKAPFPNIIYVDKNYNEDLPKLFRQIGISPILVVTEESDLKELVMINFIYVDINRSRIGFEVNKNNIEDQHSLKILPKLLLLGGTKVDIAELYEKQEEKLQDARENVKKYQLEIEKQQAQINSQKNDIEKQKTEIAVQETEINKQQQQIDSQRNSLDTLRHEVEKQRQEILINLVVLKKHQEEIEYQQKQKSQQNEEMAKRTVILENQKREIQEQQQKIDSQGDVLNVQKRKIETQQWFLLLTTAVVILTLFLIFFIYRGFKSKQKANRLLEEKSVAIQQKNFEIECQKEEILMQSQELDKTNKELEMHNLQLEEIVQERTIEYKQAKEKAEESDKLKSAFLANMSHEIRTPLNAIVGFTDIMSKEIPINDEIQQYVDIIKQSTQDLLTIINDIIDIAKIESGQLQVNIIDSDIDTELEGVYLIYNELINANDKFTGLNIVYTPDNQSSNRLVVKTDAGRVKQVFNNLLSNALKFTPAGSIEFGYKVLSNEIEFFVFDTGIGIPIQYQHSMFQRFRKINQDDEKFYSGTGLGLAISKSLVELLGGKIWFTSEQGKGTKFFFTIPLVKGAIEDKKFQTQQVNELNSFEGKTVLLCEDDLNSRMFLTHILTNLNLNVIEANDGVEALAKFRDNPEIDLVLLDIQMPRLDGYKTLVELRKLSKKNLPIIAQTAFAMTHDVDNILKSGFDDYISKPIMLKNLTDVLKKGFSI